MQRLARAVIVAVLALSASGVSSVVTVEPCAGFEPSGRDDDGCSPMCVTCGCCAQAVEPVSLNVTSSPETAIDEVAALVPRLPETRALDILHVPRPRLA